MSGARSVIRVVLLLLSLPACKSPAETLAQESTRVIKPVWYTDVGAVQGYFRLPLVTPSTVIVAGGRHLFGLGVKTGRVQWEIPLPYVSPFAGLVLTGDSSVAFVTEDGYVVFKPSDGRVLKSWTATTLTNDPISIIPQRLTDGRIVYADRARHLLALDPRAGRVDTLVRLPGTDERRSYVAALAVYRDTIYAPVASNASRGARYRNTMPYRYAISTGQLDSLRPDPSDSASLTQWLLPFGDLLVSATNYTEPSWLGFDRATGERRWKVGAAPASLGPYGQVAVLGDTLVGAGNDGRAYVIHLPTGRLLRTMPIPRGLATAVVACGSDVIINLTDTPVWRSRTGLSGGGISGLADGKDGFVGHFGVGGGIAVIGDGAGGWMALPCPPPQ